MAFLPPSTEQYFPELQRSMVRAEPKALLDYESASGDRNSAIIEAYRSGGYTLREIGDHFGLHYSTVSGIIRDHKSKT